MKSPLLSIIIPVYDSEKSIGAIIEKILKQPMKDFELLLIDDGSKDNSLSILQQFAKGDSRIKVFHKPNGGASSARNFGLDRASGKFIEFIDADDNFDSAMIEKLTNKIVADKTDLVVCGMKFFEIKGNKPVFIENQGILPVPNQSAESWKEYILRLVGKDGRLYHPANKIFRAKPIQDHHIRFQESLNLGEDLLFNLAYLKYSTKIDFLLEPLYYYYLDISSGTIGKSGLIWTNYQKNFAGLLDFVGIDRTAKTTTLLDQIKLSWLNSFARNLYYSNLSPKQKCARIKQAVSGDDFTPHSSREAFILFLARHPTMYLAVWSMLDIKHRLAHR
jgi:glycosyltransferase involved in cell wall biosynthesis